MPDTKFPTADPRKEDALADRRAFFVVAGFMAATLLVVILSAGTEIERSGSGFPLGKIALFESTGFASFLVLFPVMTRLVTFATPGERPWPQVIGIHLAASLVVAAIHISLFILARKLILPVFYGEPYTFTDNPLRDFIYEYRKSALAYFGLVLAITSSRLLAQQQRELAAARAEAQETKRITLKCGGRTILLPVDDILFAKAASNYVEVATPRETHLARATLSSIEQQLTDAGANAARVHRSYVVNRARVAKISPTGEGDVKIEMENGAVVPGSRRYRDRLAAAQ